MDHRAGIPETGCRSYGLVLVKSCYRTVRTRNVLVMSDGIFDYVIVGAGPAGCVLASRLTDNPGTRVALIEAGGPDRAREIHIPAAFNKLFQTPYDWNYHTVKQPGLADRELYWPRGRTLGGSTSINAM